MHIFLLTIHFTATTTRHNYPEIITYLLNNGSHLIMNAVSSLSMNSNSAMLNSPVSLSSNSSAAAAAATTMANQLSNQIISPSVSTSSLSSTVSSLPSNAQSPINMSQINMTFLLEPSNRAQQNNSTNKKKLELQLITKIGHIFSIFSSKTRIELIAIETPENVIQALANGLHLDMDEASFQNNWNQCLEKINLKHRKQLTNFRLDEIIKDLRYVRRSKVFVLFSLKSDQFKLIVIP